MTNSVCFDPAVGGDGSVLTDDSNAESGLGNGGHRTRFVPALAQVVAVAAHVVERAAAAVAAALTASDYADASASAAGVSVAKAGEALASANTAIDKAAEAVAAAALVNLPALSPAAENKVLSVTAFGEWVLKLLTAADVGAEPTITTGTVNDYIAGNKTIRDFAANVRMTVLTGLSTASAAAITAADSELAAFGKLQAQLNDKQAQINAKQASLVSGTNIKTVAGVTLLGAGNIAVLPLDFGHGNVGSLAFIWRNVSTEVAAGTIVSSAEYAVIGGGYASATSGGSAPGSWRLLGKAPAFHPNPVAVLAQRIA